MEVREGVRFVVMGRVMVCCRRFLAEDGRDLIFFYKDFLGFFVENRL